MERELEIMGSDEGPTLKNDQSQNVTRPPEVLEMSRTRWMKERDAKRPTLAGSQLRRKRGREDWQTSREFGETFPLLSCPSSPFLPRLEIAIVWHLAPGGRGCYKRGLKCDAFCHVHWDCCCCCLAAEGSEAGTLYTQRIQSAMPSGSASQALDLSRQELLGRFDGLKKPRDRSDGSLKNRHGVYMLCQHSDIWSWGLSVKWHLERGRVSVASKTTDIMFVQVLLTLHRNYGPQGINSNNSIGRTFFCYSWEHNTLL